LGTWVIIFSNIEYHFDKAIISIGENQKWVGRSKNAPQNWISYADGPAGMYKSAQKIARVELKGKEKSSFES